MGIGFRWKGTAMKIRKVILAFVAGSIVLGASACNTVRGAGDDLNSAADTVQKEM